MGDPHERAELHTPKIPKFFSNFSDSHKLLFAQIFFLTDGWGIFPLRKSICANSLAPQKNLKGMKYIHSSWISIPLKRKC